MCVVRVEKEVIVTPVDVSIPTYPEYAKEKYGPNGQNDLKHLEYILKEHGTRAFNYTLYDLFELMRKRGKPFEIQSE